MIQLLCNGPAGAYRQLFDLKEIGGIPSKGAYDPRSKLEKLPFYVVVKETSHRVSLCFSFYFVSLFVCRLPQ